MLHSKMVAPTAKFQDGKAQIFTIPPNSPQEDPKPPLCYPLVLLADKFSQILLEEGVVAGARQSFPFGKKRKVCGRLGSKGSGKHGKYMSAGHSPQLNQ